MWDGTIHGSRYYYKGIEISYMFYSCDDRNDYNDNMKRRKWLWQGLNILYITININYFYIMVYMDVD